MALVECPECKGQISNAALHCPHCGYRIKSRCCGHHVPIAVVILLCAIGCVLFFVFCAATVNVNSNNGMINFHWTKRGLFPRAKFNFFGRKSCGCAGRS